MRRLTLDSPKESEHTPKIENTLTNNLQSPRMCNRNTRCVTNQPPREASRQERAGHSPRGSGDEHLSAALVGFLGKGDQDMSTGIIGKRHSGEV